MNIIFTTSIAQGFLIVIFQIDVIYKGVRPSCTLRQN